jgi:hypothetical protein
MGLLPFECLENYRHATRFLRDILAYIRAGQTTDANVSSVCTGLNEFCSHTIFRRPS